MAGSLAVIACEDLENPVSAIRDQWDIQFSRFIRQNSLSSACPDLAARPRKGKYGRLKGSWISSSSTASLRLVNDFSSSESILTVCLGETILEEHFVSKLHFSWPHVSCISGFPPRGCRAVLVSYKDCTDEIQKFALRFSTNYETEMFMNALKEILMDTRGIELPRSDFGSEISSQSVLMSSNGPPYRSCDDSSNMTPSYAPQMQMSLINEVEQHSCTQKTTQNDNFEDSYTPQLPPSLSYDVEQHLDTQETTLNHNHEGIIAALPPSFTSLLTNCCSESEQAATQSTTSEEADFKSKIARYMEDSSFQDMLIKVEKVINELGGETVL